MTWIAGYIEWRHGLFGLIRAAEERGRRYFAASVEFPGQTWWPRTTEASSLADARAWIDEQREDWRTHSPTPETVSGGNTGEKK